MSASVVDALELLEFGFSPDDVALVLDDCELCGRPGLELDRNRLCVACSLAWFAAKRAVQRTTRVRQSRLHDVSLADEHDASRPGAGRRLDALVYVARPRTTDPLRVVGAKPATFCRWIFDLLGATTGDTFVDVFPGSGGVARAWDVFAGAPVAPAGQSDASRRPRADASRSSATDASDLVRATA